MPGYKHDGGYRIIKDKNYKGTCIILKAFRQAEVGGLRDLRRVLMLHLNHSGLYQILHPRRSLQVCHQLCQDGKRILVFLNCILLREHLLNNL